MRDHTKLRAFELADQLAFRIYKTTRSVPREEIFGLTSQLRRAAVSIASSIVEGSAREVQYQLAWPPVWVFWPNLRTGNWVPYPWKPARS